MNDTLSAVASTLARLHTTPTWSARRAGAVAAFGCIALASCGGGGGSAPTSTATPASGTVQVSAASTLSSGCGTAAGTGEAYTIDSAVQPQLAADPSANARLYGLWEQDRWNAIGTRAINFSASNDGGITWSAIRALPFSQCGGGSGVGAAYDRASDPSIAVGMGGVVYASALAFSGSAYLASGAASAVLFARSTDGGNSWPISTALVADTGGASSPYYFNDRDAIAADPSSAHVYVVWDTINSTNAASPGGVSRPTWLAHSGDQGQNWDAPRVIYDPGLDPFQAQTFNNQPQVLPNGSVVVLFTLIKGFAINLTVIRSSDHGTSWSGATTIAGISSMGTVNPISGGAPIRDSMNMAQTAVDPASGTLAAVWQESSFSGSLRDGIALALSHDGGVTWTAPVQVNTVGTVAAFDPGVHFGAGGRIAVTYYDFRDYVTGSSAL